MEDPRAIIRKRLDSRKKLEDIQRNLVLRGYTSDEINKIVAVFDWKAKKRD